MPCRRCVQGALIWLLLLAVPTPAALAQPCPSFLFSWGSSGCGDTELSLVVSIATDPAGNAYAVDGFCERVQKFDGAGNLITSWSLYPRSSGEEVFVCADRFGHVYVSDSDPQIQRITKYDDQGNFITSWSTLEWSGEQSFPANMATDAAGNIYVCDWDQIQKFDPDGNHLVNIGQAGSGQGEFHGARGIAIDETDNIYVVEGQSPARVQKFDSSGGFLLEWPSPLGLGQIAIDRSGNLIIADVTQLQMFDASGGFLCSFGEFEQTFGVAADASGNVFTVDQGSARIEKFGPPPTPAAQASWGRLKTRYR